MCYLVYPCFLCVIDSIYIIPYANFQANVCASGYNVHYHSAIDLCHIYIVVEC